MTREEAIKILDPATPAEALIPLCGGKAHLVKCFNEASKIAVAALRAQQEPVKLDRSRWEGCGACSTPCCELCAYQKAGSNDWPCNMCETGLTQYKPVNYCSVCGKPLTEKAWAELKRRIGGNNG